MCLSITDLFVAGLAFDVIGALLLARGLLISHEAIERLATWQGLETSDTVDRCRNRVDAAFGASYLVAGFLLQGAGYGALLAGADAANSSHRAYVAAGIATVTIGGAFLLWWLTKDRLLKADSRQGRARTQGERRSRRRADVGLDAA